MLQPVSPMAPYNVPVQLQFSSPKLEDSIFGVSELDLINGGDKDGHFCATNTNSTDNRGCRSRAGKDLQAQGQICYIVCKWDFFL